MATRLRTLKLRRVSLVDAPACEQARVVLFKSAEGRMTLDDCDVCKAELGGESRDELSDSDFAAVWTDAEGRKQRKLPIHDAAHVRNALARFNQTELPAEVKAKAKAKLEAAARKFGIGEHAEKMQPTSTEVNVDEFAGKCKKCDTGYKKGMKECPKCGAPIEPDEDDVGKAADRPKEDQMDEKLKADLAEAQATVKRLGEENDALKKRLDTPEEIEKRKLEALPESVRKELTDTREQLAKMQAERAETEQIEKARKEMPQVPGKTEDLGRLLKRFKDVAKAEDFDALVTILKAASAQIEKGGLFREVGRPGQPEGEETPYNEAMRLANEIVTKNAGMDAQAALSQVFREKPELYAAYARSVQVGARPDQD